MELKNFKAPVSLILAIETVAQRRTKPGAKVTDADVIRKAILKDKEIRDEYNRLLKLENAEMVEE